MAKRALSTALASTALSTAVVIALGSAAGAVPAQDARVSAKLPNAVVAGYLSNESMQASMTEAWNAKVAEFAAAVKAAQEEEARRAAEAAEAARLAAEQQAAAAAQAQAQQAQAVQAQSYSAPVQSYSAPAQSYAAPDYSGASGDVSSWANSGKSQSVKQCESGGNYSTNTGNGYYGAWQFDLPSWHANGGGAYASRPDLAPAWAQDQVAYNYYQKAGWGPWGCG